MNDYEHYLRMEELALTTGLPSEVLQGYKWRAYTGELKLFKGDDKYMDYATVYKRAHMVQSIFPAPEVVYHVYVHGSEKSRKTHPLPQTFFTVEEAMKAAELHVMLGD